MIAARTRSLLHDITVRDPKYVRVTPMVGFFLVVAISNLLSVPMAYLLNAEDFEFLEYRVTQDDILTAYFWTIYACALMAALYYVLGIKRQAADYMRQPMKAYSQDAYSRLWLLTFAAGIFVNILLFVQAGFRIPVLSIIGQDYIGYAKIRFYFQERINATLFNIGLYWIATANLTVAWLHLKSWFQRIASAVLFLSIGSFTLSRSPVGLGLLIVLSYRLMWGNIRWKPLLAGVSAMLGLLIVAHYIAGAPVGYGGMGEYLGVRVFYGQWASLPYYFSLFAHNKVAWSALFGPAMHIIAGTGSDMPQAARMVMQVMCPEGVDEGTAGVSSAFFIGEAYAVAGIPGVLLSPAIVMLQILVVSACFGRLEKTTLNMFLYSWFLFKIFLGVISGFSQFVMSLLQVMMLVLVYWVMIFGLINRGTGRAAMALRKP